MKLYRSPIFWSATAALALLAGSASAGQVTCSAIGFKVTTDDGFADPVCWDYGDKGDWKPSIGDFSGPGTPISAGLGSNKVLELPDGYVLWDKGEKGGDDSGVPGDPKHPGAVTMGDGTFVVTGASSLPFIFFIKQSTEWAAFLLDDGVTSGSFFSVPGDGGDYSNYGVYGGDLQTVVPLPAAVWMLGSGLLGLIAVGRRRKAGHTSANELAR